MDDRAAILAAVNDQPDADTPREVFADYLDDTGDPGDAARAAFIRAQVELARTPRWVGECKVCGATPDDEGWINHGRGCYTQGEDGGGSEAADENPERGPRRMTVVSLWTLHWKELVAGLPRADESPSLTYDPFGISTGIGPAMRYEWDRGFLSRVEMPADLWLQSGDAIRAAHPVRRVALTTAPQCRLVQANWARGGPFEWELADHPGVTDAARPSDTLADTRRRLLEKVWPGVEFTLPPAPPAETPGEWTIEGRPAALESDRGNYLRGLIEGRLTGILPADAGLRPGEFVGPLTATGRDGRVYTVPRALVVDVRYTLPPRGPGYTQVEARTVGEFTADLEARQIPAVVRVPWEVAPPS